MRIRATRSPSAPVATARDATRRRFLGLAAAAAASPLLGPVCSVRAHAAAHRDLRFRALRHGSPIGEHRVTFRLDGNRLVVATRVEIAVTVLLFTAFRYRHEGEEVWQSDRLVSVRSTTDDNGTLLQVSGHAVGDDVRIVGDDGPFLASGHLLTSDALWNSRAEPGRALSDVLDRYTPISGR